jgi:SulP family sulfate permease
MAATLVVGVEAGVSAGVLLSLVLHLYRTSRPHVAEVGLVPGTEHFRNIHRFKVETDPTVLTLRIDESLYFANTRYLEEAILKRVIGDADLRHIIIMCSAVNEIDLSALETLETLDHRLRDMGVTLHFSEVKGPVMDRLRKTEFLGHLRGEVFVSQFEGWCKLTGHCAARDLGVHAQG